jgi:predicted ATPase
MPDFPAVQLKVKSFGPLSSINVDFSPQLNVIVGDNATGKSQLLKLLYSCSNVLSLSDHDEQPRTKASLSAHLASKLIGVFRPDSLGRLTSRSQGRASAEIELKYKGIALPLKFSFATNSKSDVRVHSQPGAVLSDTPVYLPTRELLSIYPGFVSLYETRELEFDETWRDTASLLGRAPLRGPHLQEANELLDPLQEVVEGAVVEESGRFYVKTHGLGKIEANLVAEGERKLAMIIRLVQSGVLLEGGYLFWDEPEANLNPRSQRAVAKVIATLAQHGTQVFVATHSLYLLREIQILQTEAGVDARFISLSRDLSGVTAQSSEDLDELENITALDIEAEQSLRYLTT